MGPHGTDSILDDPLNYLLDMYLSAMERGDKAFAAEIQNAIYWYNQTGTLRPLNLPTLDELEQFPLWEDTRGGATLDDALGLAGVALAIMDAPVPKVDPMTLAIEAGGPSPYGEMTVGEAGYLIDMGLTPGDTAALANSLGSQADDATQALEEDLGPLQPTNIQLFSLQDFLVLDLEARFEEPLLGVHGDEELRAAKTGLGRSRLGFAIGARKKGNPLPENTSAPALGNKSLVISRLQLELEQPREALVIFEITHADAAFEIEILRPEAYGGPGNGFGNAVVFLQCNPT